ncbi:DUF1523 domain-containing protein [Sedimentitalea sp. CY04]|uniref:DUF1523 domain-containing protein n=1 Tax=Parasedimentitalea denitrificans TaxID=2211118 RepID=A0ABX0W3P3_9RHOB|nr:DUF1523 family protein [Sedimentitalea sp. CY04]NIZ60250.1 DUF1523 domain-containing protein [Sedimentitalea sp. CY04]
MVYVKWVFTITFWVLFVSVLHYTLPQHDVVRIVGTDVRRVDFGENSLFWAQQDTAQEGATRINRDVRFVETFYENGRPMVFRNEDTGWGWPPYFKLDSSNLQAELTDLASTKADPQWVVLRHYGWRNEFYSIYPNTVAVKPVDGPDYSAINWFNIVFLTLLAAFFWAIYVRWRRFRKARIDPVIEDMEDSLYAAGDAISEKRSGMRRWLDTWKKK